MVTVSVDLFLLRASSLLHALGVVGKPCGVFAVPIPSAFSPIQFQSFQRKRGKNAVTLSIVVL